MDFKFSDLNQSAQGYSIKKYLLKKWIFTHNLTQSLVAKSLGMSVEQFKEKLRNKEKFNKSQLRALIYLMGATSAFQVIYFPTAEIRREVFHAVFVDPKQREHK